MSRLLSVLLLGVAAASAQAAIITWGASTDITNDGDVSILGTLVEAYNFGGVQTTVNGVTFAAQASPSIQDEGGSPITTFTTPTLITWSNNYKSLLNSGFSDDSNGMLTLSGLTIGQNYQLQFWASQAGGYGTFLGGDPTGHLSADTDWNNLDVFGQFVLGTFTADSVGQEIVIKPDEVWSLNGYQLRNVTPSQTVPEPDGLALLGLGLAGLGWVRRRARR
jgi:hypothetical protein